MDIKMIIFDLGDTLINYDCPLDWQSLCPLAIKQVIEVCNFSYSEEANAKAQNILKKYNTRINFREYEVSSDIIFSEIFDEWKLSTEKLQLAKKTFYDYFQTNARCYEDTESTLQTLKNRGMKIGVLTDVAYGMDNEYALRDLIPIEKYIDICLTSRDVGFRKPNTKGYLMIQKSFDIPSNQITFVGNEEKDIIGANNAGMISILIDREDKIKDYLQYYTINSLEDLCLKIF